MRLERTVDGGIVHEARDGRVDIFRIIGILRYCHSVTLYHLHAKDIGQSFNGGNLFSRGHNTNGIHPTAGADFLGGESGYALLVGCADWIVGDVVEVGAALAVALDGLGIEIAVGIEGRALLVGQKDPIGLLSLHSTQHQYKGHNCQ